MLARAKEAGLTTKSGIIVGMGETDGRGAGHPGRPAGRRGDIVTVGQYLRPTAHHLPVARWWTPEEFEAIGDAGRRWDSPTCRRRRSPGRATTPGRPSRRRHRDRGRGERRPRSRTGPDGDADRGPGDLVTGLSDDGPGLAPPAGQPGPRAHGRAGRGRAAALPRRRPALADRLRGHAPRAADHAGPARSTGDAVLVVPAWRRPGWPSADDLFTLLPWADTEDPSIWWPHSWPAPAVPTAHPGWPSPTGPGPRSCWPCSAGCPPPTGSRPRPVTSPLRAVKDAEEIEALRPAGAAADRVAAALLAGEIPLIGRTEAAGVRPTSAALLVEEGHQQVNFAIVGSGPNAASPHHEPGGRVIGRGETVVCDFGGTYSRRRRRLLLGHHPHGGDRSSRPGGRGVLRRPAGGPAARCPAARSGVPAEHVDQVARQVIEEAGFGELFVHRTGHGIGIEEHEDPYLVAGNAERLRRATPSRWSRASTGPGGSGCASRTSWSSARTANPSRSTPPTTTWSWSARYGGARWTWASREGGAGGRRLPRAGPGHRRGPGRRRGAGDDLRPRRAEPWPTTAASLRAGRGRGGRTSPPTSPIRRRPAALVEATVQAVRDHRHPGRQRRRSPAGPGPGARRRR